MQMHNEPNDETQVTSARILPNSLLCGRPSPLSVIRLLYCNCVNLKTVTQAEQEGKLFGRLASVLWVCVPANVLALRFRPLETSHIRPNLLLCYCRLCVSCKCAWLFASAERYHPTYRRSCSHSSSLLSHFKQLMKSPSCLD